VKVDDFHDIIFKPKGLEKLYPPETKKELLLGALEPITPLKNENDLKDMGRFALRNAKVVLLHGSLGSGKTITTEYLLEHLRRPLMSISSGDLGRLLRSSGQVLSGT